MKKAEQEKINTEAYTIFNNALDEYNELTYSQRQQKSYRLRSCSAVVINTPDYYILKSYNTIIACIEKSTDTLVDVLRTEYGYTATSAQHITKFKHDYGTYPYGCMHELRTE